MVHTMESQEVHWSSYHASARDEESEIVAQFLAPYPYQNDQDHQELGLRAPTMYWSDHAANSSACHWSQGDSNSGSTIASNSNYFALHSDYNNYYLNEPNVPLGINTLSTSIDLNLVDEEHRSRSIHLVPNPTFIDQIDYLNEENISDNLGDSTLHATQSCPKRKFEEEFIGSHKKKSQASTQVQKNGKKAGSKMAQRSLCADEEESNTTLNRPSSSSYRSDNDSNCSQEKHGAHGAICHSKGSPPNNLNGKTRAGRGSDTDPQSLYARKRRERINERLKILQNLVPNGTKVDVSTMLEDAVQYVKFLQLQIKLLSSDELWMYAPIAYNGTNIGINLTISPPQQ